MNNFQKGPKIKIYHTTPVLVVLIGLLIFFGFSVVLFGKRAKEASDNKQIARDKIIDLEKRKEKITSNINELNTDFGKEKVFRENYGLGKEGEKVVIIVEKDEPAPVPEEKRSVFKDFFYNLFHK